MYRYQTADMMGNSHMWMSEIVCLYNMCFYPGKVWGVALPGATNSSMRTVLKNDMVLYSHLETKAVWLLSISSTEAAENWVSCLRPPQWVVKWKPTNRLCGREKSSQHNLQISKMWCQGFDSGAMLLSLFDRPSMYRGTGNEPITPLLQIILGDLSSGIVLAYLLMCLYSLMGFLHSIYLSIIGASIPMYPLYITYRSTQSKSSHI